MLTMFQQLYRDLISTWCLSETVDCSGDFCISDVSHVDFELFPEDIVAQIQLSCGFCLV